MNIFKHIFTALYKSTHDFKWIAAQRYKMVRAFVYFFVLFFVVVLIRGGLFVQKVPNQIASHWGEVESTLPDFSIEVADGELAISEIEQPYRHIFEGDDGESLLLYIDTLTTSSVGTEEALGENEDMYAVILTSKKVKFYDHELGRTETEDVGQFPAFSFTKDQIKTEIEKWTEGAVPTLFVVGVFLVTLFMGLGKLFYLLILSWLVYVVARADKKPWKFGQVYTVGLYALTIPILFQWILQAVLSITIPYVYSILAFAMMFGVIYKGGAKDDKESPGEQPEVPEPPKK
jgi:hypothetical protein